MTNRYRCDWCGRFYASALPEGSACENHIGEHTARLRADIARFNARLALAASSRDVSAPARSRSDD